MLFTSQSGVSRHIRELEDELGIEIFVRRGKRLLGMTEPGKALLALDLINKNVEKFNLKNVEVIKAYAPIDIDGEADAIFLGGTGNRLDEILLWSKEKLVPGGRLVANFIIVETFNETLRLLREYGFENIDVSVMNISKLEKLGRGEYFKPLNPIYIISCEKGRE